MGEGEKAPLRLQFNPKVRLEFHVSTITSDAGLLPFREFDDRVSPIDVALALSEGSDGSCSCWRRGGRLFTI